MQSEIFHLLLGRSLTTLIYLGVFLNAYLPSPIWNLWRNYPTVIGDNLHALTFSACTTYLPCLVNVVCERFLRIRILVDGLCYRFTEFILVLKSSSLISKFPCNRIRIFTNPFKLTRFLIKETFHDFFLCHLNFSTVSINLVKWLTPQFSLH